MYFDQFLHSAVNGLVLGSLLGMVAVGYSLVYGVVRLLNFAHGEIFVLGAYYVLFLTVGTAPGKAACVAFVTFAFVLTAACSLLHHVGGWRKRLLIAVPLAGLVAVLFWIAFRAQASLLLALPMSCVATIAAALFVEYIAYRPLAGSNRLHYLISAIGMSLALQGSMQLLFGTERHRFPDEVRAALSLPQGFLDAIGLGGFITPVDGLIVIISLATMLITLWFVEYTTLGLRLRAVADDPYIARLYGIDVTRAHVTAFAVGASLAFIAAVLFVARESALEPTFGYQQGLLAFAAAVLGGIGRIGGAFLGGLVIGATLSFIPLIPLDAVASYLLGNAVKYVPSIRASDWGYGIVYLAMICILIFRPSGLFRTDRQRAV